VSAEREGFEPSIGFTLYALSRGAPSASRPPLHHRRSQGRSCVFAFSQVVKEPPATSAVQAEEEGFEPPVLSYNGFQDRRLKPLGHSSRLGEGACTTTRLPASSALSEAPHFSSCATATYYLRPGIRSVPMYGTSAAGNSMLPSDCCPFSSNATNVRPTASPLPFSVCTYATLPDSSR
jgi:hypothetical protein